MSKKKKTTKPISPRLHGLIDYGFAAANLVVPGRIGTSRRAQGLFRAFGLVQGGLNAVTVQRYAVSKVVPFALHGFLEKNSLPIYVLAPLLAGVHRQPRARAWWLLAGAALVTVYNLTDWDAKRTAR